MAIAFDNRAVYARGQAKIIRINNETPHAVSLTKPLTAKGHEGTPRKKGERFVQLILELPAERARNANSKMQEGMVENERPLTHEEKFLRVLCG
jgi:hypothetical protein